MRLPRRLAAAIVVICLALAVAALAQAWAVRIERRNAARMAPGVSYQRDMGVALARAVYSRPDILPVYGSSELEMDIPDRAPEFFRDAPDGFMVCPMGRRGASPLILLEKAAAVGGPPACGKAVILISPVWFLSRGATLSNYAGNFSALQGMELIFKAPLSPGLRRDIARRMLAYPQTLGKTPILERGVRAAAGIDAPGGRIAWSLLLPLGLMQTEIMELQDHFESVREVLAPAAAAPAPPPSRSGLDWDRLIAAGNSQSRPFPEIDSPDQRAASVANIWRGIGKMSKSTEWKDLELLLRTFRELRVRTLLLDIPWSAPYYDDAGVDAAMRDTYYSRLRSLARQYQVPLATFQDHEYDGNFLHDPHSHLSAKGWAFFNRDIDAFWHDRPLPDR